MEDGPLFLTAFTEGALKRKAETAIERLRCCDICPRQCRVDRTRGGLGICRIGRHAVVSSYGPHFGEERPISGRSGSGTIFFSGCNLNCVYCQNHDISQEVRGEEMGPEEIADVMMELMGFGCHNINLVSPTHVAPQVLEALEVAAMKGLDIPIVYNTGGYDSLATLELLDGTIDIYMPDMKYSDPGIGRRLSGIPDYPIRNRDAVKEMHRQVGDLVMDHDGVATRGLLVRHLILPIGMAGTGDTALFLAKEVSKGTYINVMTQYRPEHHACDHKGLDRRPTASELRAAFKEVERAGLRRLDRPFTGL